MKKHPAIKFIIITANTSLAAITNTSLRTTYLKIKLGTLSIIYLCGILLVCSCHMINSKEQLRTVWHIGSPQTNTRWGKELSWTKQMAQSWTLTRFHVDTSTLTSLTPAPCRRHCDLLVVMWSSAEVLEEHESSPWLSRSLSLSSMEANTALSIQTDNRTQSRAYSH